MRIIAYKPQKLKLLLKPKAKAEASCFYHLFLLLFSEKISLAIFPIIVHHVKKYK